MVVDEVGLVELVAEVVLVLVEIIVGKTRHEQAEETLEAGYWET